MVLCETFTTGPVFVRQSKQGSQPCVLSTITHNPKYLDQFLIVLLETFTTGLIFAQQSKQGVTINSLFHLLDLSSGIDDISSII